MSIFGKTWAKNVGAVSEGRLVSEILKQENLDRTEAFGNGSRRMELSEFPNYRLTKQTWRCELQRELWAAALAGDISHPKLQILQQLHLSYWNISQTSMQAIKQAASPSTPNAPVMTEGTVLSAILWRHITRARQLSSQGVETTRLINVVNVRRRLEPPLSLDYPGNALAHAKTAATTADVESEKPLYELARQVSDSIDWWTSDRIWGLIGAIDSTPHVGKV
jgi:trichothecene 3-O-acetyltransferase